MKRTFFISVLVAIALILSLSQFNLPDAAVYGITFIVVFVLILAPRIYYMYFAEDIPKIERFMKRNIKQPMIGLYFGLANRNDDLVAETMEKVLKKYRKEHLQAIFKTIECIYMKNISEAKRYVGDIKPEAYQYYYLALIAIEENDLEEAENLIEKTNHDWMKSALYAQLNKKAGNFSEAKNYAKTAINEAKGLQKYMLFKNFEREFAGN